MNPTNPNIYQTHAQIEKVNRANQINTYREPTTWIEISEDQLPENLRTDDNEPKVIEFCKIIKERRTDNLIILKEQIVNNNGPPNSSLPPTAHRCIFWKEVDLSPQVSQTIVKEHYTVINTMNSNSEGLSIESCEEIHKQYAQKLDKCSVDAQITCAMSQEFLGLLNHIIEQGPKDQTRDRQNAMRLPEPQHIEAEVYTQTTSYICTYKYEQDFGRVIEAYPMSFEWFPKKTDDNENSPNHDDTTKGTSLENRINENIPLDSAHATTVKNICHNKKSSCPPPSCPPPPCTPPPCPPPPCPQPPPCPAQTCDPETIKIKCSSGSVDFKLKCKKTPIDCQNRDVRYECELIDEGKCIDSKVFESCDLKCERIEAIYSGQDNLFDEALEEVNGPIIVKEIGDQKDDKNPPKKVSTMICSKDGVNFNLKCTRTIPDPDYPADVRFICELGEEKGGQTISSTDILSIPIKCKQVCNVMDDSVLGDENADKNIIIEIESRGENSVQCLEENDKKCEHKPKEKKKIYACRSKPKIGTEERECDKTDESPNFMSLGKNMKPERFEQATPAEHWKGTFLENHNKTMNILRAATSDLLCTITNATKELCENSGTKFPIKEYPNVDKLECVDAAKASCEKLIETVFEGSKELKRLSRETLDGLANRSKKYICFEKECQNEELSHRKLRKISGKSSPNDCMTSINKSAKNINNDMTNKNVVKDEQSEHSNKFEKNKALGVKLINDIKKWSQEDLGIEETMNTVKKSCEDLYGQMCKTTQQFGANTSKAFNDVTTKSMKWFDNPNKNEQSTGRKNINKVFSGLTIFQTDEKTESEPEETVPSRPNWTDSIHFALTSLGDTFKPDYPEESSPYDKPSPPRQIKYSEIEELTPISSMFASLKEKICSMFYDHNESESTSSSSSFSDVSDLNDNRHN